MFHHHCAAALFPRFPIVDNFSILLSLNDFLSFY